MQPGQPAGPVDDAVREYIEAIDPRYRPLFDRLHALVLQTCPQAAVALAYRMPSYRLGPRRLYLGVWQHGVSLYGWGPGRDGGFAERHPELRSGRATLRLRPEQAAAIPDEEFRALVRAALD
ncbi:DUF1801 domain-containing protein [Streptacidiphilus sp. PB12-B1b]|nr:DUF1801 domain-containing protein [Streptacidiphilus sp. PB12-B1b]